MLQKASKIHSKNHLIPNDVAQHIYFKKKIKNMSDMCNLDLTLCAIGELKTTPHD